MGFELYILSRKHGAALIAIEIARKNIHIFNVKSLSDKINSAMVHGFYCYLNAIY